MGEQDGRAVDAWRDISVVSCGTQCGKHVT